MTSKLSSVFTGIAAKRLSDVESRPETSNQHEINGINDLRSLLGVEKRTFPAMFIYLNDDEENQQSEEGTLTWYDAREKHASRTEYRLYYSTNIALNRAVAGDLLIVGLTRQNTLAIIVAPQGSTYEHQLLWLFNLDHLRSTAVVKEFKTDDSELTYAEKQIVTSLGFEVQVFAPQYLEQIIKAFGEKFPTTSIFSAFARSTITDVSPLEEPDMTLIAWLEQEEMLFRTLENHIVSKKLKEGFGNDGANVDDFIAFSLSVQNRRKSRAGFAFENHLTTLFDCHGIRHSKGAKTERNNRPDFLFPDSSCYQDTTFPVELLTMLGVKTTAKDRWRQVLSEADRIPNKHLITLEPGISVNQTEEMLAQHLQLVVPLPITGTYSVAQQANLMNVHDFIMLVREKQMN